VNLDDALDDIEIGIYEDRVEAAKVLRAAIERVRELCHAHLEYPRGPRSVSPQDILDALDGPP
jgi:hypothetical protein